MKITVSLDTQTVITQPSPLRFKAGCFNPVEVAFTRGSQSASLPDGAVIEFALKPRNQWTGGLLVYLNAFTPSAGSIYTGMLNCASVAMLTAFGRTDQATANDVAQLDASAEVTWSVGDQKFRSITFSVIVENPLTDAVAAAIPDPESYPPPSAIALKSDIVTSNVKVVVVADSAARRLLTSAQVNVGDLVEQSDTHDVYQVLDTTLLANERGYVNIGNRPTLLVTGVDQGLLAYWKLDEESGARADATGNGHDLSDNNRVGFATGKIGNAASFNGTNYLSTVNPTPGGGVFTCCFWMKTSSSQDGNTAIAAWGGAGGGNQWMFFVFAGVWSFVIGESWPPLPVPDNSPLADWSFITVQCDGSVSKLKIDDGEWAVSDSLAGVLSESQGDCLFTLGAGGSGDGGFQVEIDEVGIWNRTLSDEEITQLYNNGNGMTHPFA